MLSLLAWRPLVRSTAYSVKSKDYTNDVGCFFAKHTTLIHQSYDNAFICALLFQWLIGWFIVINATFNNISVISWRSALLVVETGGPEKTTDLPQVTYKLYNIMLYTSP